MVAHLHYLLSLYVLKNSEEAGQAVQMLQMKKRLYLCVCVSSKQKGRGGTGEQNGERRE